MSNATDVLSQLNRDLAALHAKWKHSAMESYPGTPDEHPRMPTHQYNERMATCDHENAVAMGIDLAREIVLEARRQTEKDES